MSHFYSKVCLLLILLGVMGWSLYSFGSKHLPKHSNDILVMVIDTGISDHNHLKPWVQYGKGIDYQDDMGHGTHVAGIIAYGNNLMNDPICSRVKIISCTYMRDGEGWIWAENDCVRRATQMGVQYINFSGGGQFDSAGEREAYSKFVSQGGIVVAAAGNDGNDLRKKPYYPASYAFGPNPLPNIIVVENEDYNGKLAENSNYHPLAVRAKGTNILSTVPRNSFETMSGTSMAAPAYLHELLKQKCQEN